MKRKIVLVLIICLILLCSTGCENSGDYVNIDYKTDWIFDDKSIEIKDGYFYDYHEKFTVDENTIGLTIYFSEDVEDSWNSEVSDNE